MCERKDLQQYSAPYSIFLLFFNLFAQIPCLVLKKQNKANVKLDRVFLFLATKFTMKVFPPISMPFFLSWSEYMKCNIKEWRMIENYRSLPFRKETVVESMYDPK